MSDFPASSIPSPPPSVPLSFRHAGESDVDRIVALVESAYRGESSRRGWTTEADLLRGQRTEASEVRAAIAARDSVVLLADRDGDATRPVACCHLERRGDRAYFGMFAVDPEAQAGGIGKRVMAEAERLARDEWGCRYLEMTVIRQRGDLIAFYERRGFADTGARSPFPYGDERFGLPQRDDLEFTLLEKPIA